MKLIPLVSLCGLVVCCKVEHKPDATCNCDTLKLKSELFSIPIDSAIGKTNFYKVDSKINQQLWFTDIESIDSTQYTRLWDDYHDNNFRASQKVFKDYYKEPRNVELAFQIGPAGPLWTYFTFVLKKEKCCFILTRTAFAHARFRYKGYAIIGGQKIDSLFEYLETLKRKKIEEEANYMTASFVDNRNDEIFDVAIEEQSGLLPPDSSVVKFLNFMDEKIKWKETYPLETQGEHSHSTYGKF